MNKSVRIQTGIARIKNEFNIDVTQGLFKGKIFYAKLYKSSEVTQHKIKISFKQMKNSSRRKCNYS